LRDADFSVAKKSEIIILRS